MRVAHLALSGGAAIDSSTSGPGQGGTVIVDAKGSVDIAGGSKISSSSTGTTAGNAGSVTLSTPQLLLDGGSVIVATEGTESAGNVVFNGTTLTVKNEGFIDSSSRGAGSGGTITLHVADLASVSGGRISSNAESTGAGGNIELTAARISLADGTRISAASAGQGDAGKITISANTSLLSTGSTIATNTGGANGGNIELWAGTLLHVIDTPITATASGGRGNGGNISIGLTGLELADAIVSPLGSRPGTRPQFVILERSPIHADAAEGHGGNVRIDANVFLATGSDITASSQTGLPGTVNIIASVTDLSGSLARLPDTILQGAMLLREVCAARFAERRMSSLALVARDGIPAEPGHAVASPLGVPETWPTASSAMTAALPSMNPAEIELRCTKGVQH